MCLEDHHGESDPASFGARSILWDENKAATDRETFGVVSGQGERAWRRLEERNHQWLGGYAGASDGRDCGDDGGTQKCEVAMGHALPPVEGLT
jgi:hypothetical protein